MEVAGATRPMVIDSEWDKTSKEVRWIGILAR